MEDLIWLFIDILAYLFRLLMTKIFPEHVVVKFKSSKVLKYIAIGLTWIVSFVVIFAIVGVLIRFFAKIETKLGFD